MPAPTDDRRGELTLDDDGRLLYDAERTILADALNLANDRVGGDHRAETVVDALEALGRFRVLNLERLASEADNPAPVADLRRRIRLALEHVTGRLIAEHEIELKTTHALKDLVAAYTGLGGDLDLTPTVPGDEYARQADELVKAQRARRDLEAAVDDVLDFTLADTHVGMLLADPAGRLEPLGAALERLATVRGDR